MLDTLTAWKDTRVTAWTTAGVILAEIQEVSSLYVVLSPPLLMWAYTRVRSCLVSKYGPHSCMRRRSTRWGAIVTIPPETKEPGSVRDDRGSTGHR